MMKNCIQASITYFLIIFIFFMIPATVYGAEQQYDPARNEDIEEQLHLIADNYSSWNLYNDPDFFQQRYGLTVTDIDGNGRLELFLHTGWGSGSYSCFKLYEVDEKRKGMKLCFDNFLESVTSYGAFSDETEWFCTADIRVDQVDVYAYQGRRILMFQDYHRNGWEHSETELQPVSLKDGTFEAAPIGKYETHYYMDKNNNRQSDTTYYNADHKEISKKEFEKLPQTTYPGAQKGSMAFRWLSDRDLTSNLFYDLKKSWEGFHCDLAFWDWSVTEEKGKTLLNVSGNQEGKGIWHLEVSEDSQAGYQDEKYLLSKKNDFAAVYDFSTELGLKSGKYGFTMVSSEGERSEEYAYEYDEARKIEGDDAYGNEREYRRLLSHAKTPMKDKDIIANIENRLLTFGISSKKVKTILSYLKGAKDPYLSMFLYSYYKISLEWSSDTTQYDFNTNKLLFNNGFDYSFAASEQFATTFFHEFGHALDFLAGSNSSAFQGNDHYTIGLYKMKIENVMLQDFRRHVDNRVKEWLTKKSKRSDLSREELTEKIYTKLINEDDNITREDCHDLSGDEYKAYTYVEKELRNEMFGNIFGGGYMTYVDMDMRDVFMGWTNTKIAKKDLNKVKIKTNHKWRSEDGKRYYTLMKEGWAQFYAACQINNVSFILSNDYFFPDTCSLFRSMATEMLTILKTGL